MKKKALIAALLTTVSLSNVALAESAEPGEEFSSLLRAMGIPEARVAPIRGDESAGPYKRLVIKNANIVDGTGAPTQGPVTIVIENDKIVELRGGGTGSVEPDEISYNNDTRVIDASNKYVLPGFVDAHVHFGTPTHAFVKLGALTDPEYVGKLWLAHGVTTVRDAGAIMGLDWTLKHKKLSEEGKISAPRMEVYSMFPEGMASPEKARRWVKAVHKKGADGIKFIGGLPEVIEAGLDEARKLKIKTMYHHSQVTVSRMNVVDSARLGLDSMEHWYGLPEAMFSDKQVQDYPAGYNYNNEHDRFRHAGHLWSQTAKPGSAIWQATISTLTELDFTLDPTFSAYDANRDLMRAKRAEWHDEYAMPYISRAFEPNPKVHGSFHFDWTTSDEIAWKENFRLWMQFVNDFKNAGGRVTTGSDSGFINNLYGFGYVRELELMQEAGFHPLEVVRAATLNGAELLGLDGQTGSIQVGKKADLVIVNENPLANFKVLYGTGHARLNRESGEQERTEGVLYTIKDGIIFDAKMMRAQVRDMVQARKAYEEAKEN